MIQREYILLIMNCKKYVKKATYQKITWIPKLPSFLKYYHVIGDEDLDSEFKFVDSTSTLYVRVADDYNSLPKKVIAAYDAVIKTFDFKFIFKTDDDQILVNERFFDIIKGLTSKTPTIHYGGFIVDVKQDHLSQYFKIHPELPQNLIVKKSKYCSGRFYFLSKEAIEDLLTSSKRKKIQNEYFEDYAIGFWLDESFKTNMLHLHTNKYFTDIELSDFPRLVEEGKI